ncbi:MAG: hypothetical protein WB853_14550 [Desulfobacterales bacterium]
MGDGTFLSHAAVFKEHWRGSDYSSLVKINRQFPERLLLMGLPLTILLGFGFSVQVFPGMTLFELAVLAAMSWHNDV